MVEVLVVVGTVVFALTGALVAVEKRFDLVGVLVLAAVTAIGGGSVRDLVAGTIPPTSLTNEPLLWAVAVTGLVTFVGARFVSLPSRLLYVADTASLALFAALGAQAGLEVGFGFWGTVFTGTVSGVGGGIIRDLLSGEVPGVLYRSGDLYASAAAGGAATTFLLDVVGDDVALVAGAVLVVVLRAGSRLAGLRLPVGRTTP
jgi:uncharacterized membrane protein YeiH